MENAVRLFSKVLHAHCKDRVNRYLNLNVDILCGSSTAPYQKKELQVHLTDDGDPFFLQCLVLSEEEFQSLKIQQGLLVEFGSFPQKFVDLLELCIKENGSPAPRFLLNFTAAGAPSAAGFGSASHATLEVVEANSFKHLVHLSLKFLPGTDEQVKKHLAKCLQSVKEERDGLARRLQSTEADLSQRLGAAQELLACRTKELEETRFQFTAKLNETVSHKSAEVNEEKGKVVKIQSEFASRLQVQRQEVEERYQTQLSQLESRLSELDSANKNLLDQKYKLESIIRDMKGRLSHLEEERSAIVKDLQHLRRQNVNLDSERHERDKTLNHLRTRVAVLEQEVKDKEQVVAKTSELLQSTSEQKNRLETDLEEKSYQVNQLNLSLKSVSAEVMKGNEIIQKLQRDMKNLQHKNKLMGIVAAKQERVIQEKESALVEKNGELAEVNAKLRAAEDQVKSLQNSLDETSQKLNVSKEALKTNENVINWLNKQLNDQTIGRSSMMQDTTQASSSARVAHFVRSPLVHSTPSVPPVLLGDRAGLPAGVQYPVFNSHFPPRLNEVSYRPILKDPLALQANGISPIGGVAHPVDVRLPLRDRQTGRVVIREESEPILDPKYLMRQPTELRSADENQPPKVSDSSGRGTSGENDSQSVGQGKNSKAKPFPLQSAYFPIQQT